MWFTSQKSWLNYRAAKLGVAAGERYVDPETGLNLAYVELGAREWEAGATPAGQ